MNADAFVRGFFGELAKTGQMAPPTAPAGENIMGAPSGARLPTKPTMPPPVTAARAPRPSIMPSAGAT